MRNMNPLHPSRRAVRSLRALVIAGLATGMVGSGVVLATDIAPSPIFTATTATTEVKPNVMFVLDDSGSMSWTFMPDTSRNFRGDYGYASSQCNGVYYNPNIVYTPPVDAAGASMGNASFTAAQYDGYNIRNSAFDTSTGTGTVNLSSNFVADSFVPYSANSDYSSYRLPYTAQAAFYYVYSGTQTTEKQKNYYDTSSIFYKECNSVVGSTTLVDGTHPVNSLFTLKTVSSSSGPGGTDERTNFANWYSYYRTRMQMMKTSSGLAFKTLNDHFRVGFLSIDNNASPAFLNIDDFDTIQKSNWYSKLYSSVANNGTPLREALANTGRMYAGKISTLNGASVTNPVQYSCQQNYVILSTDGFWNGTDSDVKKLNGSTTMGNEDGALPRPYLDGAASTSTAVTTHTSTQDRRTVTSGAVITKTWTKLTTTVGASCSTPANLTPPASAASAYMSIGNDRKGALGFSATNPNSSNPDRCYSLGNSAWFCRGTDSNNPVVSLSSVTDTTGKTWFLVSSGAGNSGCINSEIAFDNDNYSSSRGVCPGTGSVGVTGKLVTTIPYTQTETISGSTTTTVDRYTGTQTSTQTTTNGVVGTASALTPTTPVFTLTENVSTTTSNATTDTCGGQPAPCPSDSGTWTAGPASPNNTCVAQASVPVAGTTAPVATTATSGGTTLPYTVIASTGPTAGTPVVTATSTGGTSNTLADVAAYYYNNNLRTSALGNCTGPVIAPATVASDLCAVNKVPANGLDTATWQHMTTFTLGLGARGKMVFSPTYLTDTAGDYFDVWKGNTAGANNCSWQSSSGTPCNWPTPGQDKVENIDDLWHAAVNGHGNYFSATDPATLTNALSSSLNVIINTPQPGTAAAAATTNPKITSANNFQFSSYFKSVEWSGELIRQTMSLTDGSVPAYNHMNPDATKYDWSAQTQLDAMTYSNRNIYTKGSSGLIAFTWAALGTAGLQGNFTTPHISTAPPSPPTGMSQFCATGTDCISASAQSNNTIATGGAAGEALVNFLRGDRSNEEGPVTDPSKYFRYRTHILGDIVSAQPQYVGPPDKSYADSGYSAFKTAQAARAAVVYAASNDGMLHAFDAATGNEKWAYIPSFVLPRLYTLGDKKYSNKHQYFVEGTPKTGDAYINGAWKTILVGGLNAGGVGYYALDITDPVAPVLLWEFTDANMGLGFGNPEITKQDNGTWVVLLSSGYNNGGSGYLYVINAATGSAITSISTDVGGSSGFSRIFAKGNSVSDNTTTHVYGGDLLGNLWRFTIEVTGPDGYSKQLLATFKDPLGSPQPITARPQVTVYKGNNLVFVGTGRYLGTTDVGNTQQQSFYGVKDNVTTTPYTSIRTDNTFIKKTAVDGICPVGADIDICNPGTQVRTVSLNTGTVATDSFDTKNGWFVDFPLNSGELEFTDSRLTHGTLAFSTSVPVASSAAVCGEADISDPRAYGYMLDYLTGGAVGTDTGVIATTLGTGISTAPQISQLPNGIVLNKYRLSSGVEVVLKQRSSPASGANLTRRISWRELISE